MIKKTRFKEKLAERITPEERNKLRTSDSDLYISDFNRRVCLRIIDGPQTGDTPEVNENEASELEQELKTFLSEYMSDHPEAHKWIILSCLELTFIEKLPMHPQKSAGWIFRDGEYHCPSMAEESVICRYCACRKARDKEETERTLISLAYEAGLSGIGEADIGKLEYSEQIREICRGNTCRNYNTSWACPPATGTLEECRKRCEKYLHMLLFSKVYDLDGDLQLEKVLHAMSDFKDTVYRFDMLTEDVLPDKLILSNEGCGICEECTWPNQPCRFPHKLHHSIEGYGFDIVRLSEMAGLSYDNGPGTVTFFGALLYGRKRPACCEEE
ncbi:MAG: hypothetical protein IKF54_05415 [Eubacterium sp.]|nr:hypothetical protein [Eubacterium sp.]